MFRYSNIARAPSGKRVRADRTNIEMSAQTKRRERATNLAGAEREEIILT